MAMGTIEDWVGRSETREDVATAAPVRALAATLDAPDRIEPQPGAAIPPLWLWLYFLPDTPMSGVGPDGHPRRGGFLPPIDLPRRMWAGSRCVFHDAARIGEPITRVSTIRSVTPKDGKAGPMVFVTVDHAVSAAGRLVMTESQDIVYLPLPERFSPPPAQVASACDWAMAAAVDPVLLFRFSALTFNGHRIHYDRPYAMETEKYPGLVVHGPLQALWLYEAGRATAPGRMPTRFSFRGLRPLFDFDRISLNGRRREDGGLDLFTTNGDGAIGMQAELHWSAN
jgi:3-methylfumaryl-CoA hydratase